MELQHLTAESPTFTCNVFLAAEGRPTLVDAGAMDGIVDEIGAHTDDLEAVVLTHQHGDHVAKLEAICDAFSPAVYAFGDHPLRTHELADGETVTIGTESFAVVHTPGHADDHVSFISETTLISGDVVVHDDGAFEGGSFGRTDRPDQSRETLIESIERILDRLPAGVESMYSGHGSVFHGDVNEIVERALERAKRREPKYPDE